MQREERQDIYVAALATWGDREQIIHTIQELGELIVELTRELEGGVELHPPREKLVDELVDAMIMLEQMFELYSANSQANADLITSRFVLKLSGIRRKLREHHGT